MRGKFQLNKKALVLDSDSEEDLAESMSIEM